MERVNGAYSYRGRNWLVLFGTISEWEHRPCLLAHAKKSSATEKRGPEHLSEVPSASGCRTSDKGLLPISLRDYPRLLDWTGRQVCGDKQGTIPAGLTPILESLHVEASEITATVAEFPRRFPRLAGTADQLLARAAEVGRRWLRGASHANRTFR